MLTFEIDDSKGKIYKRVGAAVLYGLEIALTKKTTTKQEDIYGFS